MLHIDLRPILEGETKDWKWIWLMLSMSSALNEESINNNCHLLKIYKYLNWKNHIDQVILKLDAAYYYAVRIIFLVRNINENDISLFSH